MRQIQIHRNEIQAGRNKFQIRRNEIQIRILTFLRRIEPIRHAAGVVAEAFPRLQIVFGPAGFKRSQAMCSRLREITEKVADQAEAAAGDAGFRDASGVLGFPANSSRFGDRLEPGHNVHPVAEHIGAFDRHIADLDADPIEDTLAVSACRQRLPRCAPPSASA
jgi:hypothetical protein